MSRGNEYWTDRPDGQTEKLRGEKRLKNTGIQCANEKDVQRSTSPRPASPRKRRIAILLVDGCDLVGANVIAEAFTLASRLTCPDDSLRAYDVTFLSERGG
jgi:hypothetical protein